MSSTSKVSSPIVVAVIVAVIGLVVGFGVGYVYLQPRVDQLMLMENQSRIRENMLKMKIDELEKTQMELRTREDDFKIRDVELNTRLRELNASLTSVKERLSRANERIGQLESSLNITEFERAKLERLLSATNITLSKILKELTAKKAEFQAVVDELESAKEYSKLLDEKISDIRSLLMKLDNDRLLLIEMRKDLPGTREEAHDYWENIRSVAVKSDPSLRPKIDSIIARIDIYFDWLQNAPGINASLEEWAIWLFTAPPGAVEYQQHIDDFQKDVLLVVINRIDTMIVKLG